MTRLITQEALREEIERNQKRVVKRLDETLLFVQQQGWRSRMVQNGLQFTISLWHGDDPEPGFAFCTTCKGVGKIDLPLPPRDPSRPVTVTPRPEQKPCDKCAGTGQVATGEKPVGATAENEKLSRRVKDQDVEIKNLKRRVSELSESGDDGNAPPGTKSAGHELT